MNLGFIWWNVLVTLITNLRLAITHMKLSMGPEHRPTLMRINDVRASQDAPAWG